MAAEDAHAEAVEVTAEEGWEIFDRAARREMGMTGMEFIYRWIAGEIGWDKPVEASGVAMLFPFAPTSGSG